MNSIVARCCEYLSGEILLYINQCIVTIMSESNFNSQVEYNYW